MSTSTEGAQAHRGPAAGLSGPGRELLSFAAGHRLVLNGHVQALLGVEEPVARARLAELAAAGLIRHDRVHHGQPGQYQITPHGLAAIGSVLPLPRFETVRSYAHDVGVPWLWLYARAGTFGAVEGVFSEREARGHDRACAAGRAPKLPGDHSSVPLGVRLSGGGRGDPPALHYPDLTLITHGGRVAIELQLFAPGPRRLEAIIAAYGADPEVAVAVFLVKDAAVGRTVQSAAAKLGLSAPTHVQWVKPDRAGVGAVAQ